MYFGSNMQGGNATFLYDSTFKGVAVTSVNCKSCVIGLFNLPDSSTFVGNYTNKVNITIQGSQVTGYWGRDKVSLTGLDDATMIPAFEFFVITAAEELLAVGGIMGIAPLGFSSNESYTEELAAEKKISNPVIALSFGKDETQQSTATFGGKNDAKFTGARYQYISEATDQWKLPVTTLYLNDEKIGDPGMTGCVIDTSQKSFLLSELEF